MTNTVAIDTGDATSIVNLLQEMNKNDLDMTTGNNSDGEDMLFQLVANSEEKLKVVTMQDNGTNRINYFDEKGNMLSEIYIKDDF